MTAVIRLQLDIQNPGFHGFPVYFRSDEVFCYPFPNKVSDKESRIYVKPFRKNSDMSLTQFSPATKNF